MCIPLFPHLQFYLLVCHGFWETRHPKKTLLTVSASVNTCPGLVSWDQSKHFVKLKFLPSTAPLTPSFTYWSGFSPVGKHCQKLNRAGLVVCHGGPSTVISQKSPMHLNLLQFNACRKERLLLCHLSTWLVDWPLIEVTTHVCLFTCINNWKNSRD